MCQCSGIIRDIDIDIDLDDLCGELECVNQGIKIEKLFRLKRRDRALGEFVDTRSVCVIFKGINLPSKVVAWNCVLCEGLPI